MGSLTLRGVGSYLHSNRPPPGLATGIREARRLPVALEALEGGEELLEAVEELLEADVEPELTPWQRRRAARAPEAQTTAPAPPAARAPLVDPVRFQAELNVLDQAKALGIPPAACVELARRPQLPTEAELRDLAQTLNPQRALAAIAKRVYARPT